MQKIVVIGGGTGSYNVLRGLKCYTNNLTAVVTMFDSGGSTGILRDEFGVLPPGDVRRCLLALCDEKKQNRVLRSLFGYRFQKGNGLSGHNFGNLFLTALRDVTGSDIEAIEAAASILNIRGRVLPVTLDRAHLCAELEDGSIIRSETDIDVPKHDGTLRIKRVFLSQPASAYNEMLDAIKDADKIVIGPGDLYTSLICNLLVDGISLALQNSRAQKIYVANLMTKHGESNNFRASDFVSELLKYMDSGTLDLMICNDRQCSPAVLEKYAREKAFPVPVDRENIESLGVKLVCGDLIVEPDLIRHHPIRLAEMILRA